jgi:hypothetical protein
MLDIVGLIASVITIAQVVTEAVDLAKTFYRAPQEFEALQASRVVSFLLIIHRNRKGHWYISAEGTKLIISFTTT